jgi:MFS family permease
MMEEKKYQVSRGTSIGILTVLALLWLLHYADRFILIIALTPIKEAFNLTDAQAGLLPALLTAGIGIIGIPAAVFGDRWARRKVVALMASIWSIFTLITGLSTQFWHLAVSRFGVGSGEAGYGPTGTAWISVVFSKEARSRVMAILYASSQLGMVVGLMFGGILISATQNWRTPFYVFAVPGIILAVIAYFLPDYRSVRQAGEGMLSKTFFQEFSQVFKIKSWWLVMATATLVLFLIIPLTVWIPTILTRAYGMNTAQAGITFGLIQLMVLLGPLGGVLVDKLQKRYKNARPWGLAVVALLASVFALLQVLAIGGPLVMFLGFGAVVTVLMAVFMPIILSLGQDIVPVGLRSTSGGVFNLVAQIVGSALSPVIAGAISDASGGGAHGIQVGILWMTPMAFLGIISGLLLTKFYASDSAKVGDEVIAEKQEG